MDAGVKHAGSITDEDVSVIRETWRPVYEVKEDAGVAVLVRFFTNHPSAKKYFDQFRDIQDPEEMRQNAQLRKHAVRIMTALNTMVENLHDGDKINSIFNQMGKTHALKHKVDPAYFKMVTDVILVVLVEAFPQSFSAASVQGSWAKFMSLMCGELSKAYAKAGWQSNKNSAEI